MHNICTYLICLFHTSLALILSIWLFSGNRHKVFLVIYAFLYEILALCTIFVFYFLTILALIFSIWLFSGNRHKVFLVLYAFLYGILALCTIFVFDLLNQFDAETLISFTIITTPIWSLFVLKGIFFIQAKRISLFCSSDSNN